MVAIVPHDRPAYVLRNRAGTELYLLASLGDAKLLELEDARVLIAASLEPRHPQAMLVLRKVEGRVAWEAYKRGLPAAPRAFEPIWTTAAQA